MEDLEKLNLKVRIQILDSNDQILTKNYIMDKNQVKDLRVYTNVSLVDETYLMLLDELIELLEKKKKKS